MDVWAFFSAYFDGWVGWMSGFVSLLLTGYGFARREPNQRKAFFFAAVACGFVTPIRIWTIEHLGRIAAEDTNTPRITARIGTLAVGDLAPIPDNQKLLTVEIIVHNQGAPSIVELRRVWVRLLDGRVVDGKQMPTPSGDISLGGAPNNADRILRRSNYFLDKSLSAPVPRGGALFGWSQYILPGVSSSDFAPGILVSAEMADINGQVITASRPLGDGGWDKFYNPVTRQ